MTIHTNTQPLYLIFDFDGVIANGLESDFLAFEGVLATTDMSKDDISKQFWEYYDQPTHSKSHNLTEEQFQIRLKKCINVANFRLTKNNSLFIGFLNQILNLKNVRLAIVSSSSTQFVLPVLGDYSSYFDYIFGFEQSHSKEEKISIICDNWKTAESNVFYFTDTKTDIIELQDYMNKSKIIGCAWGYQGYNKLAQLLPDNQILKNFSDIEKVLDTQI